MLSLRQFLPPSPAKTKKNQGEYLILEIGLERVVAGVFSDNENRKLLGIGKSSLGEEKLTDSVLKALDGLSAVVERLPKKAILGLADFSTLEKKIIKLERASSEKEITREELEEILENSSPKTKMDDQLYFSSLIYVILDSNLVSHPLGARGKSLEVGILNAYYNQRTLEELQDLLADWDLELQKIVPTSHALALYTQEKEKLGLLLLRVGRQKTQIISIKASSVDEVKEFDLGEENLDFWLSGLLTTLEQNNFEIPETIWVYDENSLSHNSLIAKLQTINWQEKFGVMPSITTAEIYENLLGEDLSLASLANYFLEGRRT